MEQTASVLADGGVVVLPTDTVYGIAAVAADEAAVRRIFEIKARPLDKPIALLVADASMAAEWGDIEPAGEEIATGWPGALTVVVERREGKSDVFIGGGPATVGLRVPAHDFVRDLCRRVGPLAATSANPSGAETPEDIAAIAPILEGPDLFIDGGTLGTVPSRVVSFLGGRTELR